MGIRTAASDEDCRRPADLSISGDVIIEAIRQTDREAWRAENAEAIACQNGIVAQEGAFGDDIRLF